MYGFGILEIVVALVLGGVVAGFLVWLLVSRSD
jgi:hypothetical protein